MTDRAENVKLGMILPEVMLRCEALTERYQAAGLQEPSGEQGEKLGQEQDA